jgi:hypothetical protein
MYYILEPLSNHFCKAREMEISGHQSSAGVRGFKYIESKIVHLRNELLRIWCTVSASPRTERYYKKYEPKASRRSRISGGVSARRGLKEVPPKGRDEPPRNASSRALMKISFSQLDKRISDLESQMKEVQEWRKQVQGRFH